MQCVCIYFLMPPVEPSNVCVRWTRFSFLFGILAVCATPLATLLSGCLTVLDAVEIYLKFFLREILEFCQVSWTFHGAMAYVAIDMMLRWMLTRFFRVMGKTASTM